VDKIKLLDDKEQKQTLTFADRVEGSKSRKRFWRCIPGL